MDNTPLCINLGVPPDDDVERLLNDQPVIYKNITGDCDVDTQDENGRTAIYLLYENYNEVLCKRLFKRKPDVNIPNYQGTYLIHVAARHCTADAVDELINCGADINVLDRFRQSPLHHAVTCNSTDVINILLKKGCRINDVDKEGNTIVNIAAKRCDPKVLNFVIQLGHDLLSKPNVYRKTGLHYAFMKKECLKIILSNSEYSENFIDHVDKEGKTVLHYASSYFHLVQEVKLLLDKGGDPNIRDKLGRNCLMYACKEGSVRTMDALLPHFGGTINDKDKCGNTALHYASMRADISHHVKHLLDAGSDTNIKNSQGKTPLMLALETQRSETIDLLLSHQPDPVIQDNFGRTTIHYVILYSSNYKVKDELETGAATTGDSISSAGSYIRLLVERGANVNMRDARSMTPLHYACGSTFSQENMETLLQFNADVNAKDCYGNLPIHVSVQSEAINVVQRLLKVTDLKDDVVTKLIHLAAKTSNTDMLTCLIEYGIPFDLLNTSGESIMMTAARFSSVECFRFLCTKTDNNPNLHHWSIIRQLCKRNNDAFIQYIHQNNIDINAKDEDRFTPLHYAARYCDLEIVQELVKYGAKVNETDLRGVLPVHTACKYAQKNVVEWIINIKLTDDTKEFLVRSSQVKDHKDDNGRGFLHYAAQNKNLDVILYMLDLKLNVNDTDNKGQTPLHYGAKYFTSNIVEMFCEKRANINECDKEGQTALHLAAKEGNPSFVQGLLDNGGDVKKKNKHGRTAIMLAALQLKFETVKILLDFNCENDKLSDFYHLESPLHLACKHSNFQTVHDLVENKIGRGIINDIDANGRTALHYAAARGDSQIVYVLSVCGADLEIKDPKGKTPLHMAVDNSEVSTTRLLLQHGSRVDARDNDSKTPLFYSVMGRMAEITTLLLHHGASDDDGQGNKLTEYEVNLFHRFLYGPRKSYVIHQQSYKDFYLLEMEKVLLMSTKCIFRPTKQGNAIINHIQQTVLRDPSLYYNVLVYCKDSTEDDESLRKYALLFLTAHLPYVHLWEFDTHCYSLLTTIQKVVDDHGLSSCDQEDFLSEIASKPIVLSASPAPSSAALHPRKSPAQSPHLKWITEAMKPQPCKRDRPIIPPIKSEIQKVMMRGKWHDVYKLLGKDNLNVPEDNNWSLLHYCVLHDLEEFAVMVLQHGVDVSLTTDEIAPFPMGSSDKVHQNEDKVLKQLSPLLLATLLNRMSIVKHLVEDVSIQRDVRAYQMCMKLSLGTPMEDVLMRGLCAQLKRKHVALQLHAFPGYVQTSPLERVIVCLSRNVFRTVRTSIMSVPVIIRNPDFFDDEEDYADKMKTDKGLTDDDAENIKAVISENADRLWKCHSLLNIISGACSKTNNFKNDQNRTHRKCVVLYTELKYIVPLSERPFPLLLTAHSMHIDVILREGRATVGGKTVHSDFSIPIPKILRMGSRIGKTGGESGTMGPLVDLGEDKLGFLTCAHLFFKDKITSDKSVDFDEKKTKHDVPLVVQPSDEEILKIKKDYQEDDAETSCDSETDQRQGDAETSCDPETDQRQGDAEISCDSETEQRQGVSQECSKLLTDPEIRICGKVTKAIFKTVNDTSIDAAVVEITKQERQPKSGRFTSLEPSKLKSIGFPRDPVFHSGAIVESPKGQYGMEVIQFGSETRCSMGELIFDGTQARITTGHPIRFICCEDFVRYMTCSHRNPEYIIKGQYEIKSMKDSRFFAAGDSGAGVFGVDRKDNHELTCVGLAIAVVSGGNAIVTPIKNILDALGGLKLKTFSPCLRKRSHKEAFGGTH